MQLGKLKQVILLKSSGKNDSIADPKIDKDQRR